MNPARPTVLILLTVTAVSCSGSTSAPDAGTCSAPPNACPATVPSYQNEVLATVKASCWLCHGPGGPGSPELDSYGALHNNEIAALGQLASCSMPPPDAGQLLSEDERTALMTWLVCGAPDN